MERNFTLFRKLFMVEDRMKLSNEIVDVERKKIEMEKEMENIKKKNSKFFKANYKMNRMEELPFENKKISTWKPEDVFCWLKLLNLESQQNFVREFIQEELYKMGNLLRMEGSSSKILTTLRDHKVRKRFLLNVFYLRECHKNEIPMNKHMDTLIHKIVNCTNWKRLNCEKLLCFCEHLTSREEILGLLKSQISREIEIMILITNDYMVKESLENGMNIEVDLPPAETGPFRCGILLGEWYLEWNENSFITPRMISGNVKELPTVSIRLIEKSTYDNVVGKLVDEIIKWNEEKRYSKRGLNGQHFIDRILQILDIVIYDELLRVYLSKMKNQGEQPGLPTLHVKEVQKWNKDDVNLWLKRIKMNPFVQRVIEEKKIDGNSITEIDLTSDEIKENFVEDPWGELAFQVHVHHIITNVKSRGILKYDTNFCNFSEKFLTQQREKIKGELDMNFYDLENSFFIFTTKSALMNYYLNLHPDDHIGLVILRKSEKIFHSGVIIGCLILEWKSSELIIPSRYKRENRNKTYQVDLGVQVEKPFDVSSKIANLMIEYNSYFSYKEEQDRKNIITEKNCQMFVDDCLAALGLTHMITALPKDADTYLSRIRKQGKNDHVPSSQNWKVAKAVISNVGGGKDEFDEF